MSAPETVVPVVDSAKTPHDGHGTQPDEFATLAGAARGPGPAGGGRGAVPGYEIFAEIGRGSMGVVYRARQKDLGRTVALKMVLAGSHAGVAERARFRAEAQAIARLQHPNIVQIHEVGEHDGLPFLSLEFCGGGNLARKLAGTPLPALEAATFIEVVARAMHAAHQKGVVHRDLKPANILLADDGTPKVTDFGLARQLDEAGITVSGAVMGTPSYMAPEQAQPGTVTPVADVYALGAILYEMLSGRPPFKGKDVWETLEQARQQEPVPPRQLQPKVPRDLETICLKCLHKEPARRYGSAAALADDLRRFLERKPIHARPTASWERLAKWARRKPAVAALVLVAVLFALASLASIALYALYESQQASLYKQQLEARQRIGQSLLVAQQHEAAKEWTKAEAELDKAQVALDEHPDLTDDELRAEVQHRVGVVRRALQQQAQRQVGQRRLERFKTFYHDTLFHETMFTGLDRADSRARASAAAASALAIYSTPSVAVGPGQMLDLLEPNQVHYSPDERSWLTGACYELLLILTEFEAGAPPTHVKGDPESRKRAEKALALLARAAGLGPQTRTFHLLEARCLAQRDGAPFDRAAAAKAAPAPASRLDWFLTGLDHYRIGLANSRPDLLGESIVAYEHVLQQQSNDFWAHYVSALAQLRLYRWSDAKTHLTICLNLKHDFAWPRLLRGFAASEKGFEHAEKQRSATARAARLDKALAAAEALSAKLDGQLAEIEFAAAAEDFGAALVQDPDPLVQYVGRVNRGVLFIRQQQWDKAVADLQQAVDGKPDFFQGHINLGQALQGMGRQAEALAVMDQAVANRPKLALVYESRGELHLLQKNQAKARDDFKRAIELEPQGSRSDRLVNNLVKLGELLYREGKYQDALACYETARQAQPEFAATQRFWFETLLALERFTEAGAALDAYLAVTRPAAAEIYHARGLLHARQGDIGAAVEMYTLALAQDPKNAVPRCQRGWLYLLNNAPLFALEDFEACLRQDQTNLDALLGRGNARIRLKKLEAALSDAREAEKRGGLSDRLAFNLGRIYAQAAEQLEAQKPADTDRLTADAIARYRAKALSSLHQTLDTIKTEDRRANFWRHEVQLDPAFNAVRATAPYLELQARFGGKR